MGLRWNTASKTPQRGGLFVSLKAPSPLWWGLGCFHAGLGAQTEEEVSSPKLRMYGEALSAVSFPRGNVQRSSHGVPWFILSRYNHFLSDIQSEFCVILPICLNLESRGWHCRMIRLAFAALPAISPSSLPRQWDVMGVLSGEFLQSYFVSLCPLTQAQVQVRSGQIVSAFAARGSKLY